MLQVEVSARATDSGLAPVGIPREHGHHELLGPFLSRGTTEEEAASRDREGKR